MDDEDRSHQLAQAGRNLNANLAAKLEEKLKVDENDLDSRINLLGYYGKSQYQSDSARSSLVEHVVWIVQNRPHLKISGLPYATIHLNSDSESEGYARVKVIWLSQIQLHPSDTAILANAAHFFLHHDKELAESCLLKAKKLEADNQQWAHDLALLYQLCGPDRSADALSETERMLDLTTDEELRFCRMDELPRRAFEAGDFEKAAEASTTLLSLVDKYRASYNYGNAIQSAHTTLGRIALHYRDLEKAKYHLAQSAIGAKSPQTSSFGPTMDLAEELFRENEDESVLRYLDQCKTFCGPTHRRLIHLRARIKMGIPRCRLFELPKRGARCI
jgi:tetratricopeptide (TPR) repeat protein